MLPTKNYTIVDDSVHLFDMDGIDVHSVDVSPKQQLKNIKDQQLKSQLQSRDAALSLMGAIDRAANSLLDILPNMENYVTTFENDDVTVVIARSTTGNNVTLQVGQVTMSASTNCSAFGDTDAKMVVMKKNLLSWNASTFGENVTTAVNMFSLGRQRCSLQLTVTIPLELEFLDLQQPRRQKRELGERGLVGTPWQNTSDSSNGGYRSNRTMAFHTFDVPSSTVLVVMRLSWWDHAATYLLYFRYDTPPTEELYDDKMVVKEEDVLLAWHRGTSSLKTFTPNVKRQKGRLYVGIQKSDPPILLHTAPWPEEYLLQASTVSCVDWGYTPEKWEATACGVHVELSDSIIRCNCSFPGSKAAVAGSVHLLPNSIDFDSVFADSESLSSNIVFCTVISEWALYLLLIIIFNVDFQHLREKMSGGSATLSRKRQLPLLSVLPPDRMPAPYLYQITVSTGSMFGAGTSARIGFNIFGSRGKTAAKVLNTGGESLLRGGTYDIIMPLKTSLGHLELLHIWHDNTGVDEASWFLRDIIVKDLQTDEVYHFICYDWLSDVRSDGQIQKVLHVATPEQLQSFSCLFRENSDAVFYDQHLWISPFVSPEGSSFSKTKRLSCCWAVFNTIMLSSAMWYKSGTGVLVENTVYDLGFVQFTLQELYVSVMAALMVVPVALVPVKLFRIELPAPVTTLGARRHPTHERLSHLAKYMAWVLVVLVSMVSSFFVILYSLDWGREKSEAWLKALFLSFGLSSLVTETGQILVLAILASLVCTKSSKTQKTYHLNKAELHTQLWDHKASRKVHPPMTAPAQTMQIKSKQRRRFYHVLKDFILLLMFVVVLFYISHHDKEPLAFHASQTLSSTFIEGFYEITTADEFWTWTEEIILPVLYPSFWYNGWKMKHLDRQFPLYTEAFRIGPPRLTQFRKAPEEREYPENGWVVTIGHAASTCWQFNASHIVSHNPDCSLKYIMELPTGNVLSVAASVFLRLQHNQWIDKYTQYLVLDLSFYHPSLKLFSSLRMTVQQEDIGHLSTSATVETHRLFQYEDTSDYGMLCAHIVFIALLLVHIINEVVAIQTEGITHFRSAWNVFAALSVLGSAAVVCTFGIRYHSAHAALLKINEATGTL
ncbi:polycystin-1-like protein 2 [Branchiostoma floridae x Branchiostoma japonicum]